MISPKLYKNSRVYDFFIKSLGYERSINRFLGSLQISCPNQCRILDAGCGTGLLGLHFLNRFPEATLYATDLEENFLRATLANAANHKIASDRVHVGRADISNPDHCMTLDGESVRFSPGSFDLICVGAVVGYASDTPQTLRDLVRLLAPGGQLINLEMNESPTGRFVSRRYHYRNISLREMSEVLRDEGCEVNAKVFQLKHLPAKFTRTCIIAKKP